VKAANREENEQLQSQLKQLEEQLSAGQSQISQPKVLQVHQIDSAQPSVVNEEASTHQISHTVQPSMPDSGRDTSNFPRRLSSSHKNLKYLVKHNEPRHVDRAFIQQNSRPANVSYRPLSARRGSGKK